MSAIHAAQLAYFGWLAGFIGLAGLFYARDKRRGGKS